MNQTRLGSEILSLYGRIVENNIVDHKMFQKVCNNIKILASSTDYKNREHSVIINRVEVERIMNIMENNSTVFHSYIDETMCLLLDIQEGEVTWDRWIKRYITKYLVLFMQGITIFTIKKDDVVLQKNIWTCLVERLVYDKLYNYFVGNQDINERNITRDLFQKCVSINKINIDAVTLVIDTNCLPVAMRIQYETPKYIITDRFIRTTENNRDYSIEINVHKEVQPLGDGPGDEYKRVQSYINEGDAWFPLSGDNNKIIEWTPNCSKIPYPFSGKF